MCHVVCIDSRIKKLREAKKLTQEELANAIGVSRNTVINWESNRRKPRYEDLQAMIDVFQCEANDLLNPPMPSTPNEETETEGERAKEKGSNASQAA